MKVHGAAGDASPRYDSDGDDSSSAGSVSVTAGAASPPVPIPPPPPLAPAPHHTQHHPTITDKLESLNAKYLNPHDQKSYERPPAPPHHQAPPPPHITNIGGNPMDNKIGFSGHWSQYQQPAPAVPHGVPDWWCPSQETYHHHHLMHHSGAAAAY